MKKWITVLFWVAVLLIWHASILYQASGKAYGLNAPLWGGGVSETISCDDCSGDLKFAAHFENDDDITEGDPCGCVDAGGDNVATKVSLAGYSATKKTDGTYSARMQGSADWLEYDASGGIGFDYTEGKIIFDAYIETWVDGAELIRASYSSIYALYCYMTTAAVAIEIRCQWLAGGLADDIDASGIGHTEDEYLRITVAWKTGEAGNDFSLEVCDLTPPDTTSNCSSDLEDDDMVAWAGHANELRVGNQTINDAEFYIDNLKIYGTSGL